MRSIKEQRLEDLENEFRPLLISCLESCCRGRGGLFNQHPESARWLPWPEADRLKEMAAEIHALRAEFGQLNPICEKFLDYCSLRGANIPGETRVAREFLDELNSL